MTVKKLAQNVEIRRYNAMEFTEADSHINAVYAAINALTPVAKFDG